MLSDQDKAMLLRLARDTLTVRVREGRVPTPEEAGVTVTPAMQTVMGAFVTIHKNGQLRGCIGEIAPRRPLIEAVQDHAVNAGLNDYRFQSVTADELDDLDFEISALTPPVPVAGVDKIELGTHGIVIRQDGRSAVFLPQVAPEQGWDLPTTLTHLCRKAGLPAEAWKDESMEFTVFEAIVFGEDEE